jgi:cell division protein FtsW (lipid II flippase)
LVLSITAFALVGLGKNGKLPLDLALYGTLLAGGFMAGWALIRWLAPGADPVLFPVAGTLAGIGFAMIYRLDGGLATEQFVWLAVGLAVFGVTLAVVRDHRQLNAYTYTIGLVGLVLLLLPIIPGVGREINGARLWIELGPLHFQPSELGKILIIIFLASYLDRKKELLQVAPTKIGPLHLPQAKHLGPLLVAWAVSLAVLFFEKDLGASLLFFSIFTVMLWVATARSAYLIIGVLLFVIGGAFAFQTFSHVQLRVDVWLHDRVLGRQPPTAADYQIARRWFIAGSIW